MKASTIASASLLSYASVAFAQYNQSAPFVLSLDSTTAEYDGLLLAACHTGAGEESLCVLDYSTQPTYYNTYYLNRTEPEGENAAPITDSTPGLLIWDLEVVGNYTISSSMSLLFNALSNVAQALINEGTTCENVDVSFDSENTMTIGGSTNWHLCNVNILGYNYTNLAWVIGGGQPDNDSCQKVGVTRRFI